MAIEAASPSVARSKCFLCGEASEQVVWKEDGVEGLRCECGMVYTNQPSIVEPLDLTQDFHPDHFYSLPAEFKAAWVARNCPHGRLVEVEGIMIDITEIPVMPAAKRHIWASNCPLKAGREGASGRDRHNRSPVRSVSTRLTAMYHAMNAWIVGETSQTIRTPPTLFTVAVIVERRLKATCL